MCWRSWFIPFIHFVKISYKKIAYLKLEVKYHGRRLSEIIDVKILIQKCIVLKFIFSEEKSFFL